jgi:CubicO group peptidase (beta-lactamase class C family)
MMHKKIWTITLLLSLAVAACQPARQPVKPVAIDPQELETFADAFFPAQMQALHIPGVSFVFVQDGRLLLAKGYGYADLKRSISMSPETTVMGIGSVSKPFVATAVMQLVEEGKLDLDVDVNQYLTTFQLADPFRQPVTLAHLLTHTAGFEDPPFVSNTDPSLMQPLGLYLAESMPPRTDPPGDVFRYSNHGYALAALVVEDVSGMPFDQYVEEYIFNPLGMTHSSYLLAPPLPENMAVGYLYQEGKQIPQPVDYDSDYPAGSIVSTAEDMSHFILAHLQDGCYQDACILQASTLAGMHQRQAETPYENQNVTYGFTEAYQDGQLLIGHSGATRGFGNSLNMLPDHNAGFFFSFNEECYQTSACDLLPSFRQQFLERFISD